MRKKRHAKKWPLWVIFLPLIDLALVVRYLVYGKNIALINPKGLIAHEQQDLMFFSLAVLFAIAIPALFLVYFVAWKYRESNTSAKHSLEYHQHKFLVPTMWAIPILIMLVLVSVMAPATHRLAPQKVIPSDAKPLTIQVISLRWKWLFIYPEQQIASLNFVQLPINTPVTFEMTADETPMSSFWIPNLGGQLYTMTSHVNRLNLMATTAGDFTGSSAEINGSGFAGMKFTARASTSDGFNKWVGEVKQSSNILNNSMYESLLKPSEYNPPEYFSAFNPNLYANVVSKYEGPGGHHH